MILLRSRATIYMITFSPKSITKDLLTGLPERSRKVLTDRYGLSAKGESRTLDAIGREYGITRERIRQIEAKALEKIRDHDKANALEGFENLT